MILGKCGNTNLILGMIKSGLGRYDGVELPVKHDGRNDSALV